MLSNVKAGGDAFVQARGETVSRRDASAQALRRDRSLCRPDPWTRARSRSPALSRDRLGGRFGQAGDIRCDAFRLGKARDDQHRTEGSVARCDGGARDRVPSPHRPPCCGQSFVAFSSNFRALSGCLGVRYPVVGYPSRRLFHQGKRLEGAAADRGGDTILKVARYRWAFTRKIGTSAL